MDAIFDSLSTNVHQKVTICHFIKFCRIP